MKLLEDAGWWLRAAMWAQIDRAVAWYLARINRID